MLIFFPLIFFSPYLTGIAVSRVRYTAPHRFKTTRFNPSVTAEQTCQRMSPAIKLHLFFL